jgi:hypothetical protein
MLSTGRKALWTQRIGSTKSRPQRRVGKERTRLQAALRRALGKQPLRQADHAGQDRK